MVHLRLERKGAPKLLQLSQAEEFTFKVSRDTDPAAPKRKFWWQDASGGDIPPSARRTSDRQQLLDQDHTLQLDDIDASLAQLASTHPALYQLISSTMVESHTEPSSQSSAPTSGTGQQQGTNKYLDSIHISITTPQTGGSTTQMMSSRVADSVAEANALLGVGSRSTRVRQQQATTSAVSIMQMASSGPKSAAAAAASSEAYTEALMDRYRKGSTMAAAANPSLSKASNTAVKPGDLERGSSHKPSGSSGTIAAATAADAHSMHELPASMHDSFEFDVIPPMEGPAVSGAAPKAVQTRLSATATAADSAVTASYVPPLKTQPSSTRQNLLEAQGALSRQSSTKDRRLPATGQSNYALHGNVPSTSAVTQDTSITLTSAASIGDNVSYLPAAVQGTIPLPKAVHADDAEVTFLPGSGAQERSVASPTEIRGAVSRQGSTRMPVPELPTGPPLSRQSNARGTASQAELPTEPLSKSSTRGTASQAELPTEPLSKSSTRGTASQAELPTEPLSKSSTRDNSTSSSTNYVPGSDPSPMDPESISAAAAAAAADPTALSRSSSSSQRRHDPPRKQMSRLRISTSTDLSAAAAAAAAAIQQVPSGAMTEEGSSPYRSPPMVGSPSRSRSNSPSKSVRSRSSNSAVTDQDSHSRGISPQRQGSTVEDRPATAPAAGGASPTGIRSASSSPIFRSPRVSRSGGSLDVLQLPPPPPGLERLYSLAASAAQVAVDMAEGGGNISSGAVDIAVVVAENAKRVINSLPQSRPPGSSGSGGMDSAGSSAPGSPERRSRQPHPSSQAAAAAAATLVLTAAPPSHQHTLMTPSPPPSHQHTLMTPSPPPSHQHTLMTPSPPPSHQHTLMTPSPPPAPNDDSRSASQQSVTLATSVSASSPTQQNATATVKSVTSSSSAAAAQPSTCCVITSDSEQPATSAAEQQQKQLPSVMMPQMSSHQSSACMLQSLPQSSSSPPADIEVGTVPSKNDHAATSIPTAAAVVAPGGKEFSSQSKAGSSASGTVQPVPPGIISVQPAVALALSAVTALNQEQNTRAGQNPAIGNMTPAEQSTSKESPPTLPPNPPAYIGSVAFTFPATSNHHHSAQHQHQGPSVLVPQSASDPTDATFSSSAPRHVQFHPHDEVREYLPSYPNSPASSVSSHFSPPFSTAAYGSTTSPTAAPVLLPGVRGVRPPIIFLPLSQAHQPTQFAGVRNDAQPTTPTASYRSTTPSPSLSPPSSSTASPSAHTAAYGDTAVSIKPGQLSPSRSSSQPPSPASGLPGPTHIFLPLSGHHAPRLVNIPGHKAHPLPRSRSTSPSQNKSKIMSSDNTNGGAGGGQSSERNKLQKGGANGDHDIRSTSASSQQQDRGIVSTPQGQAGTPSPSPASDSSRPSSAHSAVGTAPPSTPKDSSTAPQSAAVKPAGSTQPSTATAPAGAPGRPSAAASPAVGKQQVAVVVPSSSILLQDAAQETSTSAALLTPAQRAAVASSVDSGEATLKSKQQTDKERYSKPQRRITRLVEEVQRARKSGEEVKIRNEEKAKVQKMSFEDLEKYLGKQAALIVQLRKMQQELTALQKNKGSLEAGRAMLDKALEFEKAAYETTLDSEIERANMRELVDQQKQELSDTLQEMHLALRLSAHEATTVEQELVALENATAAGLCTGGSNSTR
ncbi:hypothetical protein CEUSTIGMA_g2717.t1 [Chlamydomonas eustigma]|uniref:Uncharacterized protein n=1 Tax=Chlamydomonas eustigma TaxID=1157962 RepID=A0A250WXC2_9CHLO|nr:hypothetical protein CEUSTIGMA_g2717.t1 [Chlamydomonas eustigma]|eukprot:GAX75272.1 hypothetical protein CEUSTIGMA_g2717.t1 [Chlamydomonas eustigma]